MTKSNGVIRAGAVAAAAVAITTAVFMARDVVGSPPFASKSEVAEVSKDLLRVAERTTTNKILILNDRLQRALAEKRGYQRSGQTVPSSLEEWIRDLCRKLQEEGSRCR